MELFGKDLDKELVVVAEAGVNHEGSIAAAVRLVQLAKEAGADAVKFQAYTPERLITSLRAETLGRVRRFRLTEEGHGTVAEEGRRLGIAVFSSAITEDMIPFLAENFPVIKLASADIDFEPAIRAAARTGKPLVVSTGNATLDEVDRAVAWIAEEIGDVPLRERLVLLQCTSAYPAPVEDANVATMETLRRRYGVRVGYSNHVVGPAACLAAVALGACMLEIHFTDSREGRTFRDHQLAMTADELRALVRTARDVRAAVGSHDKFVQPSEQASHLEIRKGVVAARALPSGTVLTADDLAYARPAIHFRASQRDTLIGRRLVRALEAGALIAPDDLAGPV